MGQPVKKAKIIEVAEAEHPRQDSAGSIGVVTALAPKDVVRLAHKSNFSHIVQKDGMAFDLEMQTAQSMVENVEQFLKDPVSIILGPTKDGEDRSRLFVSATPQDKKRVTLDLFEDFIAKIKGARRIREQALLVADELYTNAMKLGQPHAVIAPAGKQREGLVEFFAESDGSRLVLGCRDSFGELGFGQVLSRITHCFEKGIVESINQNNDGGAGIGSYMVFNTCVSYYCGVEKGLTTVVCVALPLGVSEMDLATLPKNIHLVSA